LNRKNPSDPSKSVIYGIHPVIETLKSGKRRVEEIYSARADSLDEMTKTLVKERPIPVTLVSQAQLLTLAGSPHHQGLAARVGPFPYIDLEDVLSPRQPATGPILLLDEVQDPANLGNILRAAECLGAGALVLTKDRSVAITPVVEKAAAGASAHMPVARVVNLVRAIEMLKASGYWVYGTAPEAKASVYDLELAGQLAFVLGSEGKGMRRLVREKCDHLVVVPMSGKTASLNVSQVATILLAESLRQRLAKPRSSRRDPS
jgi:23S rRNA (guanosine2251-2'-O)-methyltransferase